MKNIALTIMLLLALIGCKNEKLPVCDNISDVSLGNIAKKHAKMQATIFISNPSKDISYTLKNITLDLHINGKESGTLVSATPREILPGKKTSVAVSYLLNTADFVPANDINGQYTVDFKGTMTLKDGKSGDLVEVPIRKSQTVSVNNKKIEKQEEKASKKESRKERKAQKKNTYK